MNMHTPTEHFDFGEISLEGDTLRCEIERLEERFNKAGDRAGAAARRRKALAAKLASVTARAEAEMAKLATEEAEQLAEAARIKLMIKGHRHALVDVEEAAR